MSKQLRLYPEFVEFIPESVEPAKLYISKKYSTAVHLCCCGCGYKVVTPLNSAQWRLEETENSVSLYPSIGNWSLPCNSHYWIRDGRVGWSYQMTAQQIARVKKRDQQDIEEYLLANNAKRNLFQRIYTKTKEFVKNLVL